MSGAAADTAYGRAASDASAGDPAYALDSGDQARGAPADKASGKATSGGVSVGDPAPGVLYIVATPIGNLQDISLRALSILGAVDLVAAEDTRRTGLLLKAHGLKKPMVSYFAHNEEKQARRIIELLHEGKAVALVSDAGMPGISDPGARLVRLVIKEGIRLSVIPGPSAGISALAASGFLTDSYAFGGFFPRQSKERGEWLDRFGSFTGAVVFYESPKRLAATLRLILETWGDRGCCVARELTKRYEEFIRGSLTDITERLTDEVAIKGEIVVVLEGSRQKAQPDLSREEVAVLGERLLESGMSKKEASRRLAQMTGKSAKACYEMLIHATDRRQD